MENKNKKKFNPNKKLFDPYQFKENIKRKSELELELIEF